MASEGMRRGLANVGDRIFQRLDQRLDRTRIEDFPECLGDLVSQLWVVVVEQPCEGVERGAVRVLSKGTDGRKPDLFVDVPEQSHQRGTDATIHPVAERARDPTAD
jgi:hypothetical protein